MADPPEKAGEDLNPASQGATPGTEKKQGGEEEEFGGAPCQQNRLPLLLIDCLPVVKNIPERVVTDKN